MAVSPAVRRYYAERIFARSGRDHAPPNFRPLEVPATGRATVEGCRGGGKNVLEVFVVGTAETITDLRVACGLCNPAMYACADVVVDWARGRAVRELLALDPLGDATLAPLWDALGGPGAPAMRGRSSPTPCTRSGRPSRTTRASAPPLPEIPEPRGDADDADNDDDGDDGDADDA